MGGARRGDAMSEWGAYVFHMTSRILLADSYPFPPLTMLTTLCIPKGGQQSGAVEVNSFAGTVSLNVYPLSWEVFGRIWNDPGDAGSWVPEPPFDFILNSC